MTTTSATSTYLHVTNGTSAVMSMQASGMPGAFSIWADPLHEGPVPPGDDDAVLEARAHFLADGTGHGVAGTLEGLRGWRRILADHRSYNELVLWFEHDLFDQLNLIQLLTWIHLNVPWRDRTVSLICIGSFPGRPDFHGLGELTPDELAPLLDIRRPVTGAQYELAERAWRAFREPHPHALDELLHTDTSALEFLAPALTRFLEEYPSVRDGLSRTERRLLQLASERPFVMRTDYPRMHEGEHAYYVTVEGVADMIDTLSRTAPPLVAVADASPAAGGMLAGTVTITDAGRDVLAGRLDRVSCGFDRWFGGVHIRSGGQVWRWDPGADRIA